MIIPKRKLHGRPKVRSNKIKGCSLNTNINRKILANIVKKGEFKMETNKLTFTNKFKGLQAIIKTELKGKSEKEIRSTFGVTRYEK